MKGAWFMADGLLDVGLSKSSISNYTPDSQINEWLLKEW
mgnify:CR=1 FL=1